MRPFPEDGGFGQAPRRTSSASSRLSDAISNPTVRDPRFRVRPGKVFRDRLRPETQSPERAERSVSGAAPYCLAAMRPLRKPIPWNLRGRGSSLAGVNPRSAASPCQSARLNPSARFVIKHPCIDALLLGAGCGVACAAPFSRAPFASRPLRRRFAPASCVWSEPMRLVRTRLDCIRLRRSAPSEFGWRVCGPKAELAFRVARHGRNRRSAPIPALSFWLGVGLTSGPKP